MACEKVRTEEQLKIKIGEAKQLPGRNNTTNGTTGLRDVYCTVALDQEEITRTPTIERTLSPFFGEEYQFKIPRSFRYLAVYLWDRDKHTKQDKPIGKVAIKREELHSYNHKDHWFPLRPVDADSEVQGLTYIRISFDDGNLHRNNSSTGGGGGSSGSGVNSGGGIGGGSSSSGYVIPTLFKRKSNFDDTSISTLFPVTTSSSSSPNTPSITNFNNSNRFNNVNSTINDFKENNSTNSYFNNSIIVQRSESVKTGINIDNIDRFQSGSITSRTKALFSGGGAGGARDSSDNISDTIGTNDLINALHVKRGNHNIDLFNTLNSSISSFYSNSNSNYNRTVTLNVMECCDLAKKNGNCDPFVVVTAIYANTRKITKRTKVKKKTINPTYDEPMTFEMAINYDTSCTGKSISCNNAYTIVPYDTAELCEIIVSIWHDAGMGENIFLGEVKLQIRGRQQQNALQTGAWYFLQPRRCQSTIPLTTAAAAPTTSFASATNSGTTSSIFEVYQASTTSSASLVQSTSTASSYIVTNSSQTIPVRSCATPPGTRLSSSNNTLGSLRLKLVYTSDNVFTLATYDSLLNLFIQSLDHQLITTSAVYILGDIIISKQEVAQPLVRLFTYKNLIAPIIKLLADYEISKLTDPTTIFRGNTLASKMMDEAMRLSGLHYLHSTLRPIVTQILLEKKPCEIDPARVKDKIIETNLINLQEYVEQVFNAITKSGLHCPTILCQIFHDLRECAAKHFPHNKEVRYSVVSGFIFLRFFAPAILGPKLFDITTEPLDDQTSRTLTLISKTIQSLGNLVSSRSAQQTCKEEYTSELYKRFSTEVHMKAIKHFLEVVSTIGVNTDENTLLEEPVLLKEGMITKQSQGRKLFGRRNFKQRYFRLTTRTLSYAKSKNKKIICDIPLSEILGVEKLKEKSFKMQNIFQIIKKDRTLYVQTSNCVEEREWVDLLKKICDSNAARLEYFHPCAYISGSWTCCNDPDQYAKGCESVSPKPLEIELTTALDPARELQRLHSLIIEHLPQLHSIIDYCTSHINNNAGEFDGTNSNNDNKFFTVGNNRCHPSTMSLGGGGSDTNSLPPCCFDVMIDDPRQARQTVLSLIKIANSLDVIHRNYTTMKAKEMIYGSRQAPIGDDNYLHINRMMNVIGGGGGGGIANKSSRAHFHKKMQQQHNDFQLQLNYLHQQQDKTQHFFTPNDFLHQPINNSDEISQC